MNRFVQRLAQDFPLRHKDKEKAEVRSWLLHQLREMGYPAQLQSGRDATNVVAGDIEKAKLIFTAHYDTGLRELLPPFLSPTRPVTQLLYQALTPVLALVGSFLLSFAISFPLNRPGLMLPLFLLLLVACLLYFRFGPSETKSSLCDNASGVAALLETAASITPRYRGEVAFAFLDDGASSGKGAKALQKAYPCVRQKSVICVDCVALGDELLLLSNKGARWDGELLDALNVSFENTEKKTVFNKTDGLVYFPGDARVFKNAVTVCAVERLAGFGRIIRPRRVQEVDEENLAVIRDGLNNLTRNYNGRKG